MRFASAGTAIAAFLLALGTSFSPANAAAPPAATAACDSIGQAPNTVARFTLFDEDYRGGACITFYGYGNCTPHYEDNEGLYQLPDYGWHDRTNSVETYNQCDVLFYDGAHCPAHGDQTRWIHRSDRLGIWSNRASCVLVS